MGLGGSNISNFGQPNLGCPFCGDQRLGYKPN